MAKDFKISLEPSGKASLLKAFENIRKKAPEYLSMIMTDVGYRIQEEAQNKAPVAWGKLKSGIVVDTNKTMKGVNVVVLSKADYSLAVEEGTKPHWPDVDHILEWVKKKGISKGKDASSIAYLISRKISKKGTKAQPFFMPAVANAQIYLNSQITKVSNKIEQEWK